MSRGRGLVSLSPPFRGNDLATNLRYPGPTMLSLPLARPRAALLLSALFTATIFLSAALLFFVQPLFTKIVLPHIGGAPAVWTTAMLFFQTVLIAGYLYAHLSTKYLPTRAQVWVHLTLWAVALLFLPLAVPTGWTYNGDGAAAWQTLMLFAMGVGMPFAVLSANAPLIQSWYARSGGPSADDPYFLYGASNLGSLLALLAFPLVAEPLFGARQIGLGWAVGFVFLGLFLMASGLCAGPVRAKAVDCIAPVSIAPGRIAYWALLAFVPSSLMLAVTTKVSTDFGAIPLIWVIPLALYLLTFVLCFGQRQVLGPAGQRRAMMLAVLFLAATFANLLGVHLTRFEIALLFISFFALALVSHRRLYEARPDGSALTLFYLSMSVGGALGGLFNSILAPWLFAGLWEGLVTVVVAAIVLGLGPYVSRPIRWPGMALLAAGVSAGLVAISLAETWSREQIHFRDRSFFGTHKVQDRKDLRAYTNGTTMHGAQRLVDFDGTRPEPQLYYHANAPMAQILTSPLGKAAQTVGIVGQGVGALACYSQPGQAWHFYEIDRTVDRVARDPELFSFITSCTPDAPTHLGDARVMLADQKDLRFDVLVIDAYSSDAVPVHLTTTEAMALYMDRLTPGGVLVYHVSNRYFEIERPLARSADALGLSVWLQHYRGNIRTDPGDVASKVVVVARPDHPPRDLSNDPRWSPLYSDGGRLWTDDYANILSILR